MEKNNLKLGIIIIVIMCVCLTTGLGVFLGIKLVSSNDTNNSIINKPIENNPTIEEENTEKIILDINNNKVKYGITI